MAQSNIPSFDFFRIGDTGVFGQISKAIDRLEQDKRKHESAIAKINEQLRFENFRAKKLHEKMQKALASITIKPYDDALLAVVKKLKGVAKLTRESTDEEIVELLQQWPDYHNSNQLARGQRGYSKGVDGLKFYEAKEYNPTLTGEKLISEIRRVLDIEKPPKAAPAKTAAKPATKSAAPPAWKTVKKPAAKKKPADKSGVEESGPGPTFRKQTYGQWLATVRGSLGKELGNQVSQDDTFLKAEFEKDTRPSDAAREWRTLQEQKSTIAEDPGSIGAAPPIPPVKGKKTPDADHPGQLPSTGKLSQRPPNAIIYKPDEVGTSAKLLKDALSGKLYGAADDEAAEIGDVLTLNINDDDAHYAVILANEHSTHTLYHLHPVDVVMGGARRMDWHSRRAEYPDRAPEDVPLHEVVAWDKQGDDWIFGPDDQRVYIEVPKSSKPKKTKPAAAGHAD